MSMFALWFGIVGPDVPISSREVTYEATRVLDFSVFQTHTATSAWEFFLVPVIFSHTK